MPSATQAFHLFSIGEQRDEMMTSIVPWTLNQRHAKCVLMFRWTVCLLSCRTPKRSFCHPRQIILNVEMGSDVTFPRMREKISESWRTPQAETADPCRCCVSQLKFSLCCTMKVQHCKSHGVLKKKAGWLYQFEVMSFRSCGCVPRMRSIWLRERGQDLWTMSKRVV